MTQDQKGEFYQSQPVDSQSWVKDPDIAHELAIIEATQGADAARAREGELKRQFETGLTDQERTNITINDAVADKYPHAFNTVIGPTTGEKYYVLRRDDSDPERTTVILTPHGLLYACMEIEHRRNPDLTTLNPANLEKVISGIGGLPDDDDHEYSFSKILSFRGGDSDVGIRCFRYQLNRMTPQGREEMKNLFTKIEAQEVKPAAERSARRITPAIQTVIDQL